MTGINNTVRNERELFFFYTPSACHETLHTYVENILDGRKMDKDIPENFAVFPPYRHTSLCNIDGSLMKSNQCTPQKFSFYVVCDSLILLVNNVLF